MSGKKSRDKGARGERELAKLLYEHLGVNLNRNLSQTRDGGWDLEGCEGLCIEVKRQERAELRAWWGQTIAQNIPGSVPVLAYRANRRPWRFVVPLGAIQGEMRHYWQFYYEYTVEMAVDAFAHLVRERWLVREPEETNQPDDEGSREDPLQAL